MFRKAVMLGLAAASAPVAAQDKAGAPPTSPQFERLVRCRALAGDAERLACFDREVAALASAEQKREVVIVDRTEVTQARRSLFGLNLPSIRLFGSGDSEPDQIESQVRSASRLGDGRVRFTLADGANWVQTDDRTVAINLRPGTGVTIRKGAMGSFFARFKGAISVRVKREN